MLDGLTIAFDLDGFGNEFQKVLSVRLKGTFFERV